MVQSVKHHLKQTKENYAQVKMGSFSLKKGDENSKKDRNRDLKKNTKNTLKLLLCRGLKKNPTYLWNTPQTAIRNAQRVIRKSFHMWSLGVSKGSVPGVQNGIEGLFFSGW